MSAAAATTSASNSRPSSPAAGTKDPFTLSPASKAAIFGNTPPPKRIMKKTLYELKDAIDSGWLFVSEKEIQDTLD
jgi:hypothetical protein